MAPSAGLWPCTPEILTLSPGLLGMDLLMVILQANRGWEAQDIDESSLVLAHNSIKCWVLADLII
jgi:hypothetical protein